MLDGYKTLIGIAVAALAQVAGLLGVEFDVLGVTNSIATLAALGLALYGRLAASRPGPLVKKGKK